LNHKYIFGRKYGIMIDNDSGGFRFFSSFLDKKIHIAQPKKIVS